MAKVTLVFTRPGKQYDQKNADALIRDLDGLIEKLNSTFNKTLEKSNKDLHGLIHNTGAVNVL